MFLIQKWNFAKCSGNKQVALRKMFVDKEFRGAKFKTASLLLDTAITWAKDNAVKTVYLGTTPQFPIELSTRFSVFEVDMKRQQARNKLKMIDD